MGKGATVKVRDKNGNIRWVTPLAVKLVDKGFYTILDGEDSIPEEPVKKKEVVKSVDEGSDFKEITFDDDFKHEEEVDEIESLRKTYLELSGKTKVDKRWKEEKLNEEIEKLK